MGMLRLSNIANYLSHERDLPSAIQYLALNAWSTGEVCGVYLARINSDVSLIHQASFGFNRGHINQIENYGLSKHVALMHSIRKQGPVIHVHSEKDLNIDKGLAVNSEGRSWKTTVYIPLLPNFALSISTLSKISNSKENSEYFSALRSVLSLYIHLIDERNQGVRHRVQKSKGFEIGEKLTERQELILTLIKGGKTNITIANQMGYSESLIRQETMVIYQKLGIDGRRELMK